MTCLADARCTILVACDLGAPMTQQKLEKEVARLKIKLETLVNFLASWPDGLGGPFGRADYERDVRAALAKANLE